MRASHTIFVLSWNENYLKKKALSFKTVLVPILTYSTVLLYWPKQYDRKCKRLNWRTCVIWQNHSSESESLWKSSRYFFETKDLGLVWLWKGLSNKLYLQDLNGTLLRYERARRIDYNKDVEWNIALLQRLVQA